MRWKHGEKLIFKLPHGAFFEVSLAGYFVKKDGSLYVVGEDISGQIHYRNMAEFPEGKPGPNMSDPEKTQ